MCRVGSKELEQNSNPPFPKTAEQDDRMDKKQSAVEADSAGIGFVHIPG